MSAARPGGGGWPAAAPPPPPAPSIHYWKQHQHRQLQQQQKQELQQHTQLPHQGDASSHPQQQQQAAWCEPPSAAAVAASDSQCGNYVTTVTVAGLQMPISPRCDPVRCESVRSDAAESSCSSLSQESLSPPARLVRSVAAPDGWNRVTSNGLVVYVSPSGVSLTSGEEARQYLRTAGTCKCGLECPIFVEDAFNFDPKVITRPRTVNAGGADSPSETTKTCNHRRRRAELLQRRAAGKDVPPTFQEQRCNPHNNPFFRDQMLQAMEQMSYNQHHHHHHHQQAFQQHQHPLHHPQQLQPPPGPRWPQTPGRPPAPHLLRAQWEDLRRRRAGGRGGRRRASPCPNVDVRQLPAGRGATPSFLEDPSGYLARQTQLLNDTLQEGLSPVPAAAEVPLPSTVPLPARVGRHPPQETAVVSGSPSPSPSSAALVLEFEEKPSIFIGDTEVKQERTAASSEPGDSAEEKPSTFIADAEVKQERTAASSEPGDSAAVESPAPSRPDPAPRPAEPTQSESPLSPGESGSEAQSGAGEATAVKTEEAAAAQQTATSPAAPVPQLQPVVCTGSEVPLVPSLPAGQIILPSGQVILTQPFQPMLQYAVPVRQPLVVPAAGGALLQSSEPAEQPGRRRRRRQPGPQRSQAAQQGGVQTLLVTTGGSADGKQTQMVLNTAQGGVSLLQPVLLPGGGGPVFLQSVSGPLSAGGPLLQLVSVVGEQTAPPPAETQTRMAADSSTSDRGTPDGGGAGSPGPQEPVSSTGEPGEEAPPPVKRQRMADQDGDCEPAFCAGDLVWGAHRDLCSWPGQVVERSDVQACDPSQVWVQWFGDHTMSLEPTDGLRRFHDHGTKRNKSPAENSSFEEALKEALTAVERQRN